MTTSKLEQIKAAGDGLEVRERIARFAREGFGSIPAEDFERLKWYGLYVQRPPEAERFMMRIRVPGGRLAREQAVAIAELAEGFCRGRLDVTTRQDIQLHNVRIEDVPALFERLGAVGLSTVHACGDTPRNVVACPLDSDGLAQEITAALVGMPQFSNFPRKYKVGVSTCGRDCVVACIHDVGLRGVQKEGRDGFDLRVGGGLAALPHVGVRLGAFVPRDHVVEVVRTIADLFREEGYRERRDRARLKFLVADWGAERFRSVLEARLGRPLEDGPCGDEGPLCGPLDHIGVLDAGADGRVHLGVAVPAGVLAAEQFRALAESGAGGLRLTVHQNVLAMDLAADEVEDARARLAQLGLHADPQDWTGCVETCTGMDFCRRAVAHTKPAARHVAQVLNERCPAGRRVRVHLTGCPNSCGRVHLAEIGLSGCRVRDGEERAEGFELWFGSSLGAEPRLSEPSGWRVPAARAPEAVARLVAGYHEHGRRDESFTEFIGRVGIATLRREAEA
ncbi:MAG: nitrite/sulfite reductase [Planctomycetota bacterium]|jgi:sulfite reductase beta subunit-like hemoprotein